MGLLQDWIKALRSGRYRKIEGRLRNREKGCDDGNCVLGVALEILDVPVERDGTAFVGQQSGLPRGEPAEEIKEALKGTKVISLNQLTGLNDSGATFEELADLLEGKMSHNQVKRAIEARRRHP